VTDATAVAWTPWFETTLRAQLSGVAEQEMLDPDRLLVAYGLNSFGWMVITDDLRPWVTLPDELLLPSTFRTARSLWTAVYEAMADEVAQ
jgi:Leu/Phe-tRNA-protein transferase